MQNTIIISHRIQAFTQDDIIRRLPAGVLKEIKRTDDHPFFQLYSICHEGVTTPRIIGEGGVKTHWLRKAIQSIKGKIKKGLKLFRGHNEDSSHENRPPLGEVITSFEEEIKGDLHHCVITYHPPDVAKEAKECDICSQEGVWEFVKKNGKLFADKLVEITGIAIEKSSNEQPAFENARRLASIQAFEPDEPDNNNEPRKGKKDIMEPITYHDFVKTVRDLNIHPSQLYSWEQVIKDNVYAPNIQEMEKSKIELDEKIKEIEKLQKEKETLIAEQSKGNAGNVFKKILDTPGVVGSPTVKTYIEKMFETDLETMADVSEKSLKEYIERATKSYQVAAEVSGVIEKEKIDLPPGTPLGEKPKDNDYSSSEINPLLG